MVTLADGRRVAVRVLAEGSAGYTVVLCHPAPGAGVLDPDPEATSARGVTLLGVDRAGYGESDPVRDGEWAGIDQAADDLAAVLDRRGDGPVGVAGWSAGGWVALALAARRPELVERVAVVATPAAPEIFPWVPAEVAAALDGMGDVPPELARAQMAELLAAAAPDDPLVMVAADGGGEVLMPMVQAAVAQGMAGLAADLVGFRLRPPGFELGKVTAKTLVISGAADPVAGPRHGKALKAQLSDSRYEQMPGAGHALICAVWPRVLQHLAPGRRRPANR